MGPWEGRDRWPGDLSYAGAWPHGRSVACGRRKALRARRKGPEVADDGGDLQLHMLLFSFWEEAFDRQLYFLEGDPRQGRETERGTRGSHTKYGGEGTINVYKQRPTKA